MEAAHRDFIASLKTINAVAHSLYSATNISSEELQKSDAISCGCVLLLTGNFEFFLKGVLKAFIDEINKLGIPVDKLPNGMVHAHFHKGGVLLARYAKEEKKGQKSMFDVEDLSERIASVTGSPGPYRLVWEAFTDTQANPSPAVVTALLNDVGVGTAWRSINGLVDSGSMNMFLTTFVQIRNVCAHTGAHPNPPTGSDLMADCDNFERIATAIYLILDDQLDKLKAL
jgi:hypothetical protein